MSFLYKRELLSCGDVAVINCSHQCNVLLLDDPNFRNYRNGGKYKYFGGFFRSLPAKIVVPASGYWNVVLDLGGRSATVRHSIGFLRA
ncbi:MAG: DUF1883 domain-containing protein [Hyphomicrobiaceae bacterium]|nr:DUF1883 domain-containing protein [Hyphomicrobiaceae bacterium]